MSDLPANPTVPLTEVQRLRTFVGEVMTALRSQQEILLKRGMKLPPGTLQNLENIDKDLKGLEKQFDSDDTELTQLRALAATSAMINSSLDLDEVLVRSMDEVIHLTGAERGYIVLRDVETGVLDYRVARDVEADGRRNSTFEGSNTILSEVITSGEPMLQDNAYKDPRMQDNLSIAQLVLRSVLCVPLKYKGDVIGAVYVDNRLRAGVFTERELNILAAFANQAAVAIENARLFTRVQANLAEITEIKEVTQNVFASIGSGVITTDAQDNIILFNESAADILGLPPEAAQRRPIAEVLPKVMADFGEHMESVREQNKSEVFETELETPAHGRLALNFKLSPLKNAEQQIQGVAMVLDDVTEQRSREQKLEIIGRYLPRAMVANIDQIERLADRGERREMTCMFVDVRLLSTFPSDLRPSQVMDMLNEYLTVAADAIQEVGGVIDKYMGTEVMALFNSQLNPMEDHAFQAVRAAMLMRHGFMQFYASNGIDPNPHYYRIGIHSGVATTGRVGNLTRRDFTALGDTINLAHRLLENAGPGQIIISDATYDAVQPAISGVADQLVFEAREAIKAKGKSTATNVYEVLTAQ
jgi:adenylate cyclase